MILSEKNLLFESLIGKLTNYLELNSMIGSLAFYEVMDTKDTLFKVRFLIVIKVKYGYALFIWRKSG